jgi:hypothetical protein
MALAGYSFNQASQARQNKVAECTYGSANYRAPHKGNQRDQHNTIIMSNEFGRGVELVATRSTLRRNEPPPPPPSAFRDGDEEMNKDRDGGDKSTASSGISRGTNKNEEGVELELHRLPSTAVRRRFQRHLSSSSSPFVKQQRMSNSRGRTQTLLVILPPSLDAPPQAPMTAAAKATLRFTADPTKECHVNSTLTTNINEMLEREKVLQLTKSSEDLNPLRLIDRFPTSDKDQCQGNEDVCSTGSPTNVKRFPSSVDVEEGIDEIDDSVHLVSVTMDLNHLGRFKPQSLGKYHCLVKEERSYTGVPSSADIYEESSADLTSVDFSVVESVEVDSPCLDPTAPRDALLPGCTIQSLFGGDFCYVHDAVDNAVERIDDAINGCIGDVFQCGNENELYFHHIYPDNEEMRLRDRRHKKHMKRRTTRRYGSSSSRVGRALHKVRFGPDTILSEGTMIKEDSFDNVLQLPFDEFDQ